MGKSSAQEFSQGDINRVVESQRRANAINQITPTGRVTYSPSGDEVSVSLSPAERRILGANQAGRLQSAQTAVGRFADLGSTRGDVESAHFNRAMNLLNSQLDRREDQLRQRLANQGLPQTSGAFNREMGRFETGTNEALQQAALASVLAGGAEESRGIGNILSLLGLAQPVMPQFMNTPAITVPFSQPQQGPSPLSGLMGLGGAALGSFGGPQGALAGYQIGTNAPGAFGFR